MKKQHFSKADLAQAIYFGLDPDNDNHWSIDKGLPSRSEIARLTGNPEIMREEIEEVAPGYRREDARAARDRLKTRSMT